MKFRSLAPPTWATALCLASAIAAGPASAAAIHGALFTTDAAANVNVNQYPTKADVYLSGGPGPNAPCTAAGMDDGVYVYKITNPSGTVLLSSDTISHREFTVSGGVIVSANDHPTVPSLCGGVGVQMVPFADTPNNGGVYKAWVTRKSDYIANGNRFVPGNTKTDNFRVKLPSYYPPTADLNVYKFYDRNANGVWDGNDIPLFGWQMTVTSFDLTYNQTQLTQSPDGLTTFANLDVSKNPYSVLEGTPLGTAWHQSGAIVNGVPIGVVNPVTGLNLVAGETTEVDFGNYCKCHSGGKTLGYWSNINGQTKLNDGGTMNPEFTLLNALHLRNADGSDFDLDLVNNSQATNYQIFRTWLLNGTSVNMAYMLSVQLAAMRLNIEAGFVNPNNFYIPYGGTIGDLVADADAALAADGLTLSGDPNRALQEELKNYLDQLNNGAKVVRYTPCAFSFPY
jgi:hypothetical protein